jgi:hypothetical protein
MPSKKRKRDTTTLAQAVERDRPVIQVQVRMSADLINRVRAYQVKLHAGGFATPFSSVVRALVEKGLKAVQ